MEPFIFKSAAEIKRLKDRITSEEHKNKVMNLIFGNVKPTKKENKLPVKEEKISVEKVAKKINTSLKCKKCGIVGHIRAKCPN